jgi:hypothetical protein
VVIASVQETTTPVVDVIPQQPKDYFDTKNDPVVLNIEPAVVKQTPEPEPPVVKPRLKADLDTLANLISTDESAGKSYGQIADYYTVPGNPGNLLYEGISVTFFLNAVRLVHPDTDGQRSTEFILYSNYLGVIYEPYEKQRYSAGNGGGIPQYFNDGGYGVGDGRFNGYNDSGQGQTFYL